MFPILLSNFSAVPNSDVVCKQHQFSLPFSHIPKCLPSDQSRKRKLAPTPGDEPAPPAKRRDFHYPITAQDLHSFLQSGQRANLSSTIEDHFPDHRDAINECRKLGSRVQGRPRSEGTTKLDEETKEQHRSYHEKTRRYKEFINAVVAAWDERGGENLIVLE